MKLQICAEIEGLFLLKDKIEAKVYPYEFLLFSENGRFYISITKPVKDYIKYLPKLYIRNDVTHIEPTNPKAYNDLKDWLYYIEAMGAFNFEVSKIHIDELEVNWIYENDKEKGLIPVTSFKVTIPKRKAEKYIHQRNLSNLVFFRKMLPEAHIPFSYYRQACVFFNERNYYFAFINYFMMLEFCFAEGKFKTNEVIKRFKKSKLLKLCVLSAISMTKQQDASCYKWLCNECKCKQKDITFESILYILIEYRGILSHASPFSKKYLLSDNKLRPLVILISLICFLLCGNIQIYCCSNEEDKDRLIEKSIEKLEEELHL